jgi:cell division protein FtsB
MAYISKAKIIRKYNEELKAVEVWKQKQKEKRKRVRDWCNITTIAILQLVVVALIIVFYGVFAMSVMSDVKADTVKVGEGNFVMAVSYTESYDDLQYVANFADCDLALDYYNKNCTSAYIMACQLEEYLYLPMNHNVRNEFSSFDFEIDTKQSCGFVGVQKLPKFTGVK